MFFPLPSPEPWKLSARLSHLDEHSDEFWHWRGEGFVGIEISRESNPLDSALGLQSLSSISWLCPVGTNHPSTQASVQLIPAGSCLRALLSQTAVYIFVCANNLKYECFALLFTPLNNINYCREPSSLEKGGEKIKPLWKSCRPCKYLKGHLQLLQNCTDKWEQQ